MKPDKKSNYTSIWEKTLSDNIPLIHERAFIKYKDQIKNKYQEELTIREVKEFEELKRNQLLICECCYAECILSKCSTCNDDYIFCNSCIINGTQACIAQGTRRISCFKDNDGEFKLPILQKVLSLTQFSIFTRKK